MLVVVLVSLLVPRSEADVPPPVVGGEATTGFAAVGMLVACQDAACGTFCSGTLVAPQWVLTAAHCMVKAGGYRGQGYDLTFVLGPSLEGATHKVGAGLLVAHEQYVADPVSHDIGVMGLDEPIDDVEPVALNHEPVTDGWIGRELAWVGYGVTGDGLADGGTKRYADMPVYLYDSEFIYALDLEDGQNICSGDSGGPALERTTAGFEVAGVNSFVFGQLYSDKECEGGGAGATRVDACAPWIHGYIGGGDTGEEDTGERTSLGEFTAVPLTGGCGTSPAAGGLLLALAALMRRRR